MGQCLVFTGHVTLALPFWEGGGGRARVRGSVPGLGGLKETKMVLPHPRVKVSIVGSLRDREVACSASDRQGSNFESCVWRTVSSYSSHHPQKVLLAQFSLYVHKGGLKPDSFHFYLITSPPQNPAYLTTPSPQSALYFNTPPPHNPPYITTQLPPHHIIFTNPPYLITSSPQKPPYLTTSPLHKLSLPHYIIYTNPPYLTTSPLHKLPLPHYIIYTNLPYPTTSLPQIPPYLTTPPA